MTMKEPKDWRVAVTVVLLSTTAIAMMFSDARRIRDLEIVNVTLSSAMQKQGGEVARYAQALQNLQTVAVTHAGEITSVRNEVLRMRLASKIHDDNSEAPADDIAAGIVLAAQKNNVGPWLIFAVAQVESHFRVHARGTHGERGLMQLMPATARSVGLEWAKADNIKQNLNAGARYLSDQLKRHDGAVWLALLSYNGGGNHAYPQAVLVNLYAEVGL